MGNCHSWILRTPLVIHSSAQRIHWLSLDSALGIQRRHEKVPPCRSLHSLAREGACREILQLTNVTFISIYTSKPIIWAQRRDGASQTGVQNKSLKESMDLLGGKGQLKSHEVLFKELVGVSLSSGEVELTRTFWDRDWGSFEARIGQAFGLPLGPGNVGSLSRATNWRGLGLAGWRKEALYTSRVSTRHWWCKGKLPEVRWSLQMFHSLK